jgi:DNA-binding GntR family transcriptional regulator
VIDSDGFNRVSLAEQVEQTLREEIITNKLQPNQRIDVTHYAHLWSISPTPIRDAIKSLEAAGFVTVSPRRGVNVADLNKDTLREIYEVRIAIECTAIRMACQHVPQHESEQALAQYRRAVDLSGDDRAALLSDIDLLVHEIALEHCNNTRLRRTMSDLKDLVRWSRFSMIENLPKAYDTTLPEHVRICEALVDRDGDRAAREMFVHLSNSLDRITRYLVENPTLTGDPARNGERNQT